jgi:hypothetical protein
MHPFLQQHGFFGSQVQQLKLLQWIPYLIVSRSCRVKSCVQQLWCKEFYIGPYRGFWLGVMANDAMNVVAPNSHPEVNTKSPRNFKSTTDTYKLTINWTSSGWSTTAVTLTTFPTSSLLDVQSSFQRCASTESLDLGNKCDTTKLSRLTSIPPFLKLYLKRFYNGWGVCGGNAHPSTSAVLTVVVVVCYSQVVLHGPHAHLK